MNILDLKDMIKRYTKLESEQIHEELFQTTSQHKYYQFGVAHGLYFIYNTINEYNKKGIVLSNVELMQVIRECANLNENLAGHFIRMLKDIKSE